jgi:hypothetical protein
MKRIISIVLFLFFALTIFFGYYIFHKPISEISTGIPAFSAVFNLLLASAVLAFCGGFGHRIMRQWQLSGLSAFALQAGLGMGIASLLWLTLGAVGLYNRWIAYLVLIAGWALLYREIINWVKNLSEWKEIWLSSAVFERILLVACSILIINQLWIAFSPPTHYDALSYHLQLPRLYLDQGRLIFDPTNPYWGHTQLGEMLYTWTMALATPQTSSTFGWLVGVVFFIGIAGFTRKYYPSSQPDPALTSTAVCVALTALLVGMTARNMLGWSYTDLFSALLGLCVFTCLFEWLQTGRDGWFHWMGLAAGLLVGTKYTSGLLAASIFLTALILPALHRISLRVWLQSGLLAFFVFLPWLVKNAAYTGNPVYPYFFPTQTFPAERLAMADPVPSESNWLTNLFLPVTYTWTGGENIPGPGTDLGPLLVLFAIPGLIYFRKEKGVQYFTTVLVVTWAVIGIGGARYPMLTQPRLFFSVLPALAVSAGWGWSILQNVTEYQVRIRRVAGLLIIIPLALSLWTDTGRVVQSKAPQYLLAQISEQDYLYENTGVYILAMNSLKDLPSGHKILMLWEARGLYAPADAVADPWVDRYRVALRTHKTPQAILNSWKQEGFTDILLDRTHMEAIRDSDVVLSRHEWAMLDQMLLPLPSQPLAGDFYTLYRLN